MERRRRSPFLLCATRFAPGDSEWLLHISARAVLPTLGTLPCACRRRCAVGRSGRSGRAGAGTHQGRLRDVRAASTRLPAAARDRSDLERAATPLGRRGHCSAPLLKFPPPEAASGYCRSLFIATSRVTRHGRRQREEGTDRDAACVPCHRRRGGVCSHRCCDAEA